MNFGLKGKLDRPKSGAGAPSFTTDRPLFAIPVDAFAENGFPKADENGVRTTTNVVLKDGCFAIPMYYTSGTKDYSVENTGEQDAERFMLKVVASHPGDSTEATEFMVNNQGKGFVLFAGNKCGDTGMKMIGDICNPLYLKPSFKANKDKTGFEVSFEQSTGSRYMHKVYYGDLPLEEDVMPEYAPAAIKFLNTEHNVVKVAEGTSATTVKVTALNYKHNDIVTLVGKDLDESTAGTLSDSTGNSTIRVMLDKGIEWKSLKDSTISFRVFEGKTNTYLIETARS
ncbi:MAG: hypothetical protein CSA38_01955 [Flavobacteriales bacterium]|nr:MAG: hypothetical protein CSA38_01955 [Flavobacteriales bacterium]